MKFKSIIAITIVLLINGCASTSLTNNQTLQEAELISAFNKNPNDYIVVGALGDFYKNQHQITKNSIDAKKAIKYYKKFLALQPNHLTASVFLYDLHYQLHVANNEKNLDKLKNYFTKLPKDIQEKINPPELAEILRQYFNNKKEPETQKIKKLALSGVKNSPKSHSIYIILYEIYNENKSYTSAIALLKQGVKLQPKNKYLLKALGDAYSNKANNGVCFLDDHKSWKNAITYYSKAKKVDPDNTELRSELAFAYFTLNKLPLGLNEAQSIYRINPTKQTAADLAEAYIINRKFDKSLELLEKINNLKGDISYITLAQLYFRSGNWEQSLKYYKKYDVNDANDYHDIYDSIIASVMSDFNRSSWPAEKYMPLNPETPWQEKLVSFWTDKITEKELLNHATDNCKRTEANNYIGIKYYQKNNNKQAAKYFNSVLDQKIYLFIEDALSLHLLDQINKNNN